MKIKFMQSKDVVRSNEIKVEKEYVYLQWMVNMYWDMDAEISQRIRIGWKTSTMIKDVLKTKIDKCNTML